MRLILILYLLWSTYIKLTIINCRGLYFADIPKHCIDKFSNLSIIATPKKQTVIIGLTNFSPHIPDITMNMCEVGELHIGFIDAGLAETIDDSHPTKFWFHEDYSPKRKYRFIYSNTIKAQ